MSQNMGPSFEADRDNGADFSTLCTSSPSRPPGMAVLDRRWLPLNKGLVSVLALSRQDDDPDPKPDKERLGVQQRSRSPRQLWRRDTASGNSDCGGRLGAASAGQSPVFEIAGTRGGILHRRQSRSTRCRGCAMISVSPRAESLGAGLCVFSGWYRGPI
jgi:hypothetical protein